MSRSRTAVSIGAVAVVVAAAGVGVGVGVTAGGGGSPSPQVTGAEGAGGSMRSYYQSMMRNYQGGSMMGGSTGSISYGWMIGGPVAPGWMRGGTLPASMMGTSTDVAGVMGRFLANAPGPRVSATEATQLGNLVNPTITVRSGARITLEVVNADSGAAHGLVVTAGDAASSGLPMMAAVPAPTNTCARSQARRRMAWPERSSWPADK